jgi:hypothetical protein
MLSRKTLGGAAIAGHALEALAIVVEALGLAGLIVGMAYALPLGFVLLEL